jgi:hypothetical protein
MLAPMLQYLHQSLRALGQMKEADDPFCYAQAHFFMGLAYGYVQSMGIGKRYIRTAVEVVRKHGIRFVPNGSKTPDGSPESVVTLSMAEPVECVRERAALLAEMVYVENMFYLMGQPAIKMDFELEEVFELELPVRL